MTPEGRIKAMVKRRMSQEFPGCYHFMPVQNGMGAPSLDFLYCIRGLFIAVETKAPGKKPTPRQETTIAQITAAGGAVFVVDGADSLDFMVSELHKVVNAR